MVPKRKRVGHYVRQADRQKINYLYGHRAALEYLGMEPTKRNIVMLKKANIAVRRGQIRRSKDHRFGASPKYYYPTDKLDKWWYLLNREAIVSELKAIASSDDEASGR